MHILQRRCTYRFSRAFPTSRDPDVNATNNAYGGWNTNATHVFFANGMRDPWLQATLSADGLDVQNTSDRIVMLSDGFHISDLYTANGVVDASVARVQQAGMEALARWVSEWKPTPSVSPDGIFSLY